MKYGLLVRVIEELAGILPDSRVEKVIPVNDDHIALLLYRKRRSYIFLIAPEPTLPRLHLLSRKPTATASTAPFFLSLKKYLTGSGITCIRLVNQDRVAEIRFSRFDQTFILIVELLGSSCNAVLTAGDGRIMAVHRPVPPGELVRRPLVPGFVYELPAPRWTAGRASAGSGGLPAVTGESVHLAANKAAEAMFERIVAERELTSLRRSLGKAIKQARLRAERRCEAVQGDLAVAQKGDDFRRMGELILANLQRIGRGQAQADLQDPEGGVHQIALDPSRSPWENADRYFKRYKKSKAGMAVLQERLSETRTELDFLSVIQGDLEAAAGPEALAAVRKELTMRGLCCPTAGRAARQEASSAPYRTITYEGWNILIGRSAAGNDYVTMHIARPDDLWLHAEGIPGSHVLVSNPRKRDIPPSVLGKAASLAAYYSKGKGSSKVPVAYTPAKYVGKPKGAAPGTVVLKQRRSIVAAPQRE